MPSDYKKLLFYKNYDVEGASFVGDEKKPPITFNKVLKVVLIWICLFSIAVWSACFTFTLAHSMTRSTVALEKPLMDENCFITYFVGIEEIFESPELFERETVKKLQEYARFQKFAHHQAMRKKYYFIDPIAFLTILFIAATTIEIYHFCCCCVYKKNSFTSRFLPCFHVYYVTLICIFFVDALVYASQLDDTAFLKNCAYQFRNY